MVRIKEKKAKGDDAFKKRKQKTGRKKLAPVTDTRAEVHARSLYIATPSSISKESQYLNSSSEGKSEEYREGTSGFSFRGSGQQETVKELLRGATHYKSSQRSSCYASVARLILQAEKRRKNDRIAEAARSIIGSPLAWKAFSDGIHERDNKIDRGHRHEEVQKEKEGEGGGAQEVVEPMEKLRAFSLALDAMTDTEVAVRRAALSVLQALFREGWVCPHTPQEEALEDQALVYRYYCRKQEHGSPHEMSLATMKSTDAVWMLVAPSSSSKSSSDQQKGPRGQREENGAGANRGVVPSFKSSSFSAPVPAVCAALSFLHENRGIPVLYQAGAWWREEVGVVAVEDLLKEMSEESIHRHGGPEESGSAFIAATSHASPVTVSSSSSSSRPPLSSPPREVTIQKNESRRAAQKVALENVTAILHTVYICLTHAFNPVRWTGVELLEHLLLQLQLEGRRLTSTEGEDYYQGLFRQACRMVCRKQPGTTLPITSFSPPGSPGKQVGDGASGEAKRVVASPSFCAPSAWKSRSSGINRALEASYHEEIWMLHLLRRVSNMVLRTPHLPVLASLVDALLLTSSPSAQMTQKMGDARAGSASADKTSNGEENFKESPVDILASLRSIDTNGSASSFPSSDGHPLGMLWSAQATGTTALSIATPSEWCHVHLVQSAFAHVFLPPWSIAWKELMDQRLELLRQEHAMMRAVALARVVGTVATFLHIRQSPSFSSSLMHGSRSTANWELRYPSPFSSLVSSSSSHTASSCESFSSSIYANADASLSHRPPPRQREKHNAPMKIKECRQTMVDVFVRQVPFSLPTLLQSNVERGAMKPIVDLTNASIPKKNEENAAAHLSLSSVSSTVESGEEMSTEEEEEEAEENQEEEPSAPIVHNEASKKEKLSCGAQEMLQHAALVGTRKRQRSTASVPTITNAKKHHSTELDGSRPSRHSISPKLLRHRFALAQALAMVAAPLASYFPDALKLLHLYFSFMFPSPAASLRSLEHDVPEKDRKERQEQGSTSALVTGVPLIPSLEALSGALSMLLLVLHLHRPRSSPFSVGMTQSAESFQRTDLGGSSRTTTSDRISSSSAENSGLLHRSQEQEQYALQAYQKTLLFAPSVVAAVLNAMKQYHISSSNIYVTEDSSKSGSATGVEKGGGRGLDTYGKLQYQLASGDWDIYDRCTTTSLSSSDTALVQLLLSVRQLLLALAQFTAPYRPSRNGATWKPQNGNRASSSVKSSGVEMEVFKSLHRVWLSIPRLLFSCRVQFLSTASSATSPELTAKEPSQSKGVECVEKTSETEVEGPVEEIEGHVRSLHSTTSPAPSPLRVCFSPEQKLLRPVGPLLSHPALIDAIVFSYLHSMWSMVRHQHVILQCSSNEGEAIRAMMRGDGMGLASTNAPSCLDVLKNVLSSLKGFIVVDSASPSSDERLSKTKKTVVQGVLSRCSRATRRLAQRLAFYLGDTSSNFMMHNPSHHLTSGNGTSENASCEVPLPIPEVDMVSVANHLESILSSALSLGQ